MQNIKDKYIVDLSRIPMNGGAKLRSGWAKIQEVCENVHPNLVLVLLFVCTKAEMWERSIGE